MSGVCGFFRHQGYRDNFVLAQNSFASRVHKLKDFMKKAVFGLMFLAISVATSLTTLAQPGGFGGPALKPDVNSAMLKLFGKTAAFSSDAEMKVEQPGGKTMVMNTTMAVLDGKMRSEIDMAGIKGSELPPQAVAQMKAMGMDKMVSLLDPTAGTMFVIYPNLKSYTEMPITKKADPSSKEEAKIEKTELGKETIDGHPTVKNKVKITDDGGKTHEMTIWNATDLKDFPVKMTMTAEGANTEVLYKNIKLNKPDASQFAPPSDFKKYPSFQEMMMENIQKRVVR